jgi:hypothetical protein
MIYKFRVILDDKEDIFRDIAIERDATLEDLHNAIINGFGFDGTETGSFYTCEKDWAWNEEDEIPLFDIGEVPGEVKTMAEFKLDDLVHEQNTKLDYVYDFFNMWTFFVELGAIESKVDGETYPALLFSHGQVPAESATSGILDSQLEDENIDDIDGDDLFDGDDSFEDFGFEENWN